MNISDLESTFNSSDKKLRDIFSAKDKKYNNFEN